MAAPHVASVHQASLCHVRTVGNGTGWGLGGRTGAPQEGVPHQGHATATAAPGLEPSSELDSQTLPTMTGVSRNRMVKWRKKFRQGWDGRATGDWGHHGPLCGALRIKGRHSQPPSRAALVPSACHLSPDNAGVVLL